MNPSENIAIDTAVIGPGAAGTLPVPRQALRRTPEDTITATTTRFAPRTLTVLMDGLLSHQALVARWVETVRTDVAEALSQRDLIDLNDAEVPTVDSEASPTVMLGEWAEHRLSEIEEALARVADGTYGYCTGCGRDIPLERIRALPATATCVGCSHRMSHRIG
jgi:RNA polymerase-binding transcription factor DksA